jgi:hypothetical protein
MGTGGQPVDPLFTRRAHRLMRREYRQQSPEVRLNRITISAGESTDGRRVVHNSRPNHIGDCSRASRPVRSQWDRLPACHFLSGKPGNSTGWKPIPQKPTDPCQGRLACFVTCFLVSWCLSAWWCQKSRSENPPSDFAAGGVDRRGFPAVSSVVECGFAPGTEPGQGSDALTSRVWDFRGSPRSLAPREPDGWFGEIRPNRTARRKQPEEFRARSSVGRATDF